MMGQPRKGLVHSTIELNFLSAMEGYTTGSVYMLSAVGRYCMGSVCVCYL